MNRTPRPGEIFYLTKDKPYQIITLGIHKETCESMVIYQALFEDYSTYVLPLSKFLKEVQVPTSEQVQVEEGTLHIDDNEVSEPVFEATDEVNHILLSFLEADSYSDKLDLITSHSKEIDDRLINNMAASLDCAVDDGPMDERLQGLIYCLKQMSRFEIRR